MKSKLLPERKKIFEKYNTYFKKLNWAILPPQMSKNKESSYHLYMIRIKNMSENDRDLMIEYISKKKCRCKCSLYPNAYAYNISKTWL